MSDAEQIRVVDGWCPIHGSLQEVSPFKPWADSRKAVVDNYHCDVCMKDGVYTPILIATEPAETIKAARTEDA